jgi:hypothetical protein
LNLNFEVVLWYGSSCVTNTSHQIYDLAETWGGGYKISDATGSNSGYWFFGTTLPVNPNCNGLICAHCLPADRADSLVDTTDRFKSENPDRLLRIYQQ